jgi:hypothetical protein
VRRRVFGWDEPVVSTVFPEFSMSPGAILGQLYA